MNGLENGLTCSLKAGAVDRASEECHHWELIYKRRFDLGRSRFIDGPTLLRIFLQSVDLVLNSGHVFFQTLYQIALVSLIIIECLLEVDD